MNAPKPRKRPRWGVKFAAVGFCLCGWHGASWYGKGGARSAAAELEWHRDRCPQGRPS